MYSKRVTIENSDLTSGEFRIDLPIIKSYESSNNTRDEVLRPSSMTCWNNSGHSISLVFLTSGELIGEYAESQDNFGGIAVGYDVGTGPDTLLYTERVPSSDVLIVKPDDTMTGKIELSFFTYNKRY